MNSLASIAKYVINDCGGGFDYSLQEIISIAQPIIDADPFKDEEDAIRTAVRKIKFRLQKEKIEAEEAAWAALPPRQIGIVSLVHLDPEQASALVWCAEQIRKSGKPVIRNVQTGGAWASKTSDLGEKLYGIYLFGSDPAMETPVAKFSLNGFNYRIEFLRTSDQGGQVAVSACHAAF